MYIYIYHNTIRSFSCESSLQEEDLMLKNNEYTILKKVIYNNIL